MFLKVLYIYIYIIYLFIYFASICYSIKFRHSNNNFKAFFKHIFQCKNIFSPFDLNEISLFIKGFLDDLKGFSLKSIYKYIKKTHNLFNLHFNVFFIILNKWIDAFDHEKAQISIPNYNYASPEISKRESESHNNWHQPFI